LDGDEEDLEVDVEELYAVVASGREGLAEGIHAEVGDRHRDEGIDVEEDGRALKAARNAVLEHRAAGQWK
jgi:hypothetical protein